MLLDLQRIPGVIYEYHRPSAAVPPSRITLGVAQMPRRAGAAGGCWRPGAATSRAAWCAGRGLRKALHRRSAQLPAAPGRSACGGRQRDCGLRFAGSTARGRRQLVLQMSPNGTGRRWLRSCSRMAQYRQKRLRPRAYNAACTKRMVPPDYRNSPRPETPHKALYRGISEGEFKLAGRSYPGPFLGILIFGAEGTCHASIGKLCRVGERLRLVAMARAIARRTVLAPGCQAEERPGGVGERLAADLWPRTKGLSPQGVVTG